MKALFVVVALLAVLRCSSAGSGSSTTFLGTQTQIKGTHLELRPISMGRCTHVRHALVETVVKYRMSGRTRVVMDVDAVVNRTVKQYTQMHITISKCKDVVSEKTCVPFNPVVQKEGICTAVLAPFMPWSDLVSKLRPTVRCPPEEGNYSAHNFNIDMTGVDTLLARETKFQQLEGYTWQSRMLLFEANMLHLCFEGTFEFVRVRNAGTGTRLSSTSSQASSTVHPRANHSDTTVSS